MFQELRLATALQSLSRDLFCTASNAKVSPKRLGEGGTLGPEEQDCQQIKATVMAPYKLTVRWALAWQLTQLLCLGSLHIADQSKPEV